MSFRAKREIFPILYVLVAIKLNHYRFSTARPEVKRREANRRRGGPEPVLRQSKDVRPLPGYRLESILSPVEGPV